MKTFTQFSEDVNRLEQRRQQLRQRQQEQIAKQKKRVAAYQAAQRQKIVAQREREQLKRELKRELQTEQSPATKPNLYSQLVARRQASQKSALIKHAHQEMGAEARTQEAAHQARLKKLTGTP